MPGLTGLVGSGGALFLSLSWPRPRWQACEVRVPSMDALRAGHQPSPLAVSFFSCPWGTTMAPTPRAPISRGAHGHMYETQVRYSGRSRCCVSVCVPNTTRIDAERLVFSLDYFYLDFPTFFLIHTLLLFPTVFSAISLEVLGLF